MTIEAWIGIGTALTLAALSIGLFAWLRADMREAFRALEGGMHGSPRALETGGEGELRRPGERLHAVACEQARICGFLKGLALAKRAPLRDCIRSTPP